MMIDDVDMMIYGFSILELRIGFMNDWYGWWMHASVRDMCHHFHIISVKYLQWYPGFAAWTDS